MAKTIYLQEPNEFNLKLAEALKQIPEMNKPEWIDFVKSGVSKERVPEDEDFWYKRTASILRQLYLKGVVGVGKLRTRYGSKKERGVKPKKFRKASGKIIRSILQQAEQSGIVEKVNNRQFGRRLTEQGRELLDSIKIEKIKSERKEVEKENNKKVEKSNEVKQEKIDGEETQQEE